MREVRRFLSSIKRDANKRKLVVFVVRHWRCRQWMSEIHSVSDCSTLVPWHDAVLCQRACRYIIFHTPPPGYCCCWCSYLSLVSHHIDDVSAALLPLSHNVVEHDGPAGQWCGVVWCVLVRLVSQWFALQWRSRWMLFTAVKNLFTARLAR